MDKNPALGQIEHIMKIINGLTIPTGFLRILSSIWICGKFQENIDRVMKWLEFAQARWEWMINIWVDTLKCT